MSYQIGAARSEITPDAIGVTMLGWGHSFYKVRSVATPLYARAIVVKDSQSGRHVVFLCLDVCFITEILRQEIIDRLGLVDSEIVISATHTHSAPGGYSANVFYDLSMDGFHPHVFETYVAGSVQAIRSALARLQPGEIRFGSGEFPVEIPVAFNRSIRAWNLNPETKKVTRKERHLAVDREMTLMRFDTLDGKPIALWNWFAVHATTIHGDNFAIHSDNKGIASVQTEDHFAKLGTSDFVAVYAQGPAGDVSPNFKYYPGSKEKRGASRDDRESCRINAQFHFDQAMQIYGNAKTSRPLPVKIETLIEYHDFSSIAVDPDFVGGRTGVRTGYAEVGLPQLDGTAEGRGISFFFHWVLLLGIRASQLAGFFMDRFSGKEAYWPWSEHPVQGNKISVIQAGLSKVLGISKIENLPVPDWADPTVGSVKRWAKLGILKERPLTPNVLPVHILCVGPYAIVAVPAEFTTTSGRRIKSLVEEQLKSKGVERVIVQAYANSFSSYVVTPEEYVRQGYEAGCTQFGRWTLPAYQTVIRKLCQKMLAGEKPLPLRPSRPSEKYLKAMTAPSARV